jgi:hypothetical protein
MDRFYDPLDVESSPNGSGNVVVVDVTKDLEHYGILTMPFLSGDKTQNF